MTSFKISRKIIMILGVLGILLLAVLSYQFVLRDSGVETLDYSGKNSFLEKALEGKLRELRTRGQQTWGIYETTNGQLKRFKTVAPVNPTFYLGTQWYPLEDYLAVIYKYNFPDADLKIIPGEQRTKISWETHGIQILITVLVLIGLGVIFYLFMGRQWLEGKKFLEKTARKFKGEKVSFDNIAGIDEVKTQIKEIVNFAKQKERYKEVMARVPKGIILHGPPGCGKTLIAKAIAHEADIPFFGINGSEFVEMFVGVGAARVRALFEQAKKNAPCVIFVDELDALLMTRGRDTGGGAKDENNQTVNQFLAETDGIESGQGIIILGATNQLGLIDPASIRPGRFDEKIYVPLPDAKGREEILKVHTRGKPLAEDVNLESLARALKLGTSGADIANICNKAALLTVRKRQEEEEKKKEKITSPLKIKQSYFEESIYEVLYGPERKSRVMSDEDKRGTAYHEAGHAIITKYCPHLDPVNIITIVPRGELLGLVDTRPEKETFTETKERIDERFLALLGGLAAEEIFLGTKTTGPRSDLAKVTFLKLQAKYQYGMGDIGPVGLPFDLEEIIKRGSFNETFLRIIEEVGKDAQKDLEKAKEILGQHKKEVEALVNKLMTQETLKREEFEEVIEKAKKAD